MSSLAHADIVKKGYLKYRASKSKKNGTCAPGPKSSYKEFYVVFRASSRGEKHLDFYLSDKKYAEHVQPKWTVDLSTSSSVSVLNDNKCCFYVEHADGAMCLFEGKSTEEVEDWISCFNAVLFTKGPHGENTLYYEVDLYQSDKLQYHGPAYLELTDGFLIVWTSVTQEEVVRWKLSHIRSFKAKKMILTIYSGSRSSTGVGEFHFNSAKSVQITHAIETLVARLKTQRMQLRPGMSQSEQRPLPPSPFSSNNSPPQQSTSVIVPNPLEYNQDGNITSSVSSKIPDFDALKLYEDVPGGFGNETGHSFHPSEEPRQASHGGATSSAHFAPGRGLTKRASTAVLARKTIDYEDVPGLEVPDKVNPPLVCNRMGFEDITDGPLDATRAQSKIVSSGSRLKGIQKSPVLSNRKSPPPQPLPYRGNQKVTQKVTQKVDVVYAVVDKSAKTKARPKSIMPTVKKRPLADKQLSLSNSDLTELPDQSPPFLSEEYGKLNHHQISVPPTPEEYGKLSHNHGSVPSTPEEYGKLSHNHGSVTSTPEEYGKLSHNHASVPPTPEEYGKLNFGKTSGAQNSLSVSSPEEYGSLDYGGASNSNHTNEEYGRLDLVTDVMYSTPDGAYGPQAYSKPKGDATPPKHGEAESTLCSSQTRNSCKRTENERQSSFDLYGTLTAEELEEQTKHLNILASRAEETSQISGYEPIGRSDSELADSAIYSEIDDKTNKRVRAPPPGYENSILKPTPAEEASYKSHSDTQAMSQLSPPRTNSRKHGYVNVGTDGILRQVDNSTAPVIPSRNRSNNANSMLVPASDSHHESHVYKKENSFEKVSPPSPPRRGASAHGSSSPPRSKKPPMPASPKPKVKPQIAHKPIHYRSEISHVN